MSSKKCCLKNSIFQQTSKLSNPENHYIRNRLNNMNWNPELDYIPWFPGGFSVNVTNTQKCHIGQRKCPSKENMISGPSGTTWRLLLGLLHILYNNKNIYKQLNDIDPMYNAALAAIAWLCPQGDHLISEIIMSCYAMRTYEIKHFKQLKWCTSCLYFIDPLTDLDIIHEVVDNCINIL